MTDNLSNVPRRLRRFYRHNMPVPEELAHIGEKKTKENSNPSIFQNNSRQSPTSSNENEDELREPWMSASSGKNFSNPQPPASPQKPLSRRDQRKMDQTNSVVAPVSATKPGLFSKILQSGNPKPTTMDHALGLQQKQQFEEKLPRSGEKILDTLAQKNNSPPSTNPDLANTLNELKRLAGTQGKTDGTSNTSTSLASFHFTPVAGAPNPVDPKRVTTGLSTDAMTPRQRMEMRRMKTGTAGFGAGSDEEKKPGTPEGNSTPSLSAPSSPADSSGQVPAHIRRRAGRIVQSGDDLSLGGESTEERDTGTGPSPFDDVDAGSMKDLLGDEKPKKKKSPGKGDEDDDLSLDEELDEDIKPLDEEK